MKPCLEDYLFDNVLSREGLTLESLTEDVSIPDDDKRYVYVILTDTKTQFSKVSRLITGDPYNHISIALDDTLTYAFTFSITNGLNKSGGFMREDLKKEMAGSRYSMYRVTVTPQMYLKIENRLNDYFKKVSETSYNLFGLVNAITQKGIFKDQDGQMICSQFVAALLSEIGVNVFKNRILSTVRPYEFVRSKLLTFVRRGTIK